MKFVCHLTVLRPRSEMGSPKSPERSPKSRNRRAIAEKRSSPIAASPSASIHVNRPPVPETQPPLQQRRRRRPAISLLQRIWQGKLPTKISLDHMAIVQEADQTIQVVESVESVGADVRTEVEGVVGQMSHAVEVVVRTLVDLVVGRMTRAVEAVVHTVVEKVVGRMSHAVEAISSRHMLFTRQMGTFNLYFRSPPQLQQLMVL